MASKSVPTNPLVITGKTPDTSLAVQLHPLVLLTISDYITRHTIRQQKGGIVGAVIGQQNGRSFTLEVAFECTLVETSEEPQLDVEWFSKRLELYKEVHKDPALDLVALFTIGPAEGPQSAHIPLLKQAQAVVGSDSVMLLLFHPQLVDSLRGGKLPISLYESSEETDKDETHMRFRELAFEVETSDAEIIGVDYVAKGGGNATAVPKADAITTSAAATSSTEKKKGKGKANAKEKDVKEADASSGASILSTEDDELVASLTAKINAIKMLNERINLIRSYLTTLPPSYLTDSSSTKAPSDNTNFQLLRSVSSMLSRLPLLVTSASSSRPSDSSLASSAPKSSFQEASEKEKQDVHLAALLANLTRSISEAQSMGAKLSVFQREKMTRERAQGMGRRFGGGESGILADDGP